MPKLFGNLPAQIKSDSRRSFICPSVIPGITFFKNPWQILLPDADSLIRDHKLTGIVGFIPVYMYCNRVIFAAVLNRIDKICSTTNSSHFSSESTISWHSS